MAPSSRGKTLRFEIEAATAAKDMDSRVLEVRVADAPIIYTVCALANGLTPARWSNKLEVAMPLRTAKCDQT